MNSLYVLGGQQSNSVDEYKGLYKRGVIVEVNLETGDSKVRADHVSPPEVRGEDTGITFKAGTLRGDRLYACTETEVLIYAFPSFEQTAYISLPRFNDLHHVRPTANGTLLIANTGLDMIIEVTYEGEVLHEWNVLGENPWERFSKDVDYRRISTKPHEAHPNYVFQLGEDIWATRFHQKDAVCLTRRDQRINIEVQRPHDGVVSGDHVYFTTVDGQIVIADRNSRQVEEAIDLNSIHDLSGIQKRSSVLGWCRGLAVDGSKIWVGFSRLRPTKHRENIGWVKRGLRNLISSGDEPTRVACYDVLKKECLKEIDLEPYGLNAVFSILPESRGV